MCHINQRKISRLAEGGNMTMIYVTHYPEEILSLFEQCIILQQGKIIDWGKLTEVMTSERLTEFLVPDSAHGNGIYPILAY